MSSPSTPDRAPQPSPTPPAPAPRRGVLDWIEWAGNKLPEPAILFAILAAIVVVASAIGSAAGWKVQPVQPTVRLVEKLGPDSKPVLDDAGKPKLIPQVDASGKPIVELKEVGQPLEPRSLLTSEGIYWMLSSMIRNFTMLPALGLVFVSMLGIGLAEKFGLFGALMRALAMATPRKLLTPVVIFVGANSSVASDAGYIILPPLAAALYLAVGRSPIAGLAAAFAGVAGGFGGGWFPTAADGFLAGVATGAAHIVDPAYPAVNHLHNFYFKGLSAVVVMLAGWVVTDLIVEPRLLRAQRAEQGGGLDSADTSAITDLALKPGEVRGLIWAGATALVILGAFAAMVLTPNGPLAGVGQPTTASGRVLMEHPVRILPPATDPGVAPSDVLLREPLLVVEAPAPGRLLDAAGDRWSQVIVPLIFFLFLIPGMVYGRVTGVLTSQRDFIEAIYHGIRTIVPVLAISFFMGQFVAYFTYTGLDRMLAYAGGSLLVSADLPVPLLIALFVLLVVAGDFAMSGMLSKFGVMAPIFIPMFMMVGMSPELTTAAYRIGDSVVNIITPLNSYLLIILVVLQKYRKDAGLGSLISLMLPYSVVFGIVWTLFLLAWWASGFPLGVDAPLGYIPPH